MLIAIPFRFSGRGGSALSWISLRFVGFSGWRHGWIWWSRIDQSINAIKTQNRRTQYHLRLEETQDPAKSRKCLEYQRRGGVDLAEGGRNGMDKSIDTNTFPSPTIDLLWFAIIRPFFTSSPSIVSHQSPKQKNRWSDLSDGRR
jgi:hypothetical protein